jgi:hypothetical protein
VTPAGQRRPLVHIGLAKAASTFLQETLFARLSTVQYLGKRNVPEELDAAGRAIVRRLSVTWRQEDVEPAFRDALRSAAASGRRPLYSEEDLSVFKFIDPETCARRLRSIIGPYDVLLIVRDPMTWIQSQYHFRLSTFHPLTLWGMDHWLRHHLRIVGIGSDVTEIRFGSLAKVYSTICGGDVHILPYELLVLDKADFAERLADIVGADLGEVSRLFASNPKPLILKSRITRAEADFIRTARFIVQRDFKSLSESIDRYAALNGAQTTCAELTELRRLIATEDDDFENWKKPLDGLRRWLRPCFRGQAAAEEPIAPEFVDRLTRLARQELRILRKEFHVDFAKMGVRFHWEERSSARDRAAFCIAAKKLLSGSAPKFDLRRLAKMGREWGVLSIQEQSHLESHNGLPVWLRDSLESQPPPEASRGYHSRVICRGSLQVAQPPRVVWAAWLPQTFRALEGRGPDVELVLGQDGKFLGRNYLKTAVVADGYIRRMTDVAGLWAWDLVRREEPAHLAGRTFICMAEGSSLLSHWMFDVLPRFEALRMSGIDPLDFDHFYLATASSGYHKEGLQQLGISVDKVVTRESTGELIACDEFAFVSPVRAAFCADGWVYDFVSRLFTASVQPGRADRKLYISRARASRRRVVDEQSGLWPLLRERGFEIVFAEEHGIQGMARLCGEASHLVAPHGAGLANVVFARPGTKVLELYGAHLSCEYWRICNARGLEYYCLQGLDARGAPITEERISELSYAERNGADICVDPSALASALDLLTG